MKLKKRGRRLTISVESFGTAEVGRALRVDPRLRSLPLSFFEPPEVSDTKLLQQPSSFETLRLTNVEIFAGAGGLALGCQKAGFSSLAALEWDRWACDTIQENKLAGHELVRDWEVTQGDVREFDWSTIREDVDLVSGGPPCQPFSAGGRGRSMDDERDMFPATAEVLAALRPRAFLIENVRGLTRAAFADYYEYILRRLETPELVIRPKETWFEHLEGLRQNTSSSTLRYNVYPTLLNAADFGVPQQRHRVFIVGFRSDLDVTWEFPVESHSKDALMRSMWITGSYWDEHEVPKSMRPEPPSAAALARAELVNDDVARWLTLRDALKGLPDPTTADAAEFRNHEFQPGARSYKGHTGSPLDLPAKTLKAGVHGVPGGENMIRFHDGSVRYLTVRESARVQTFPDDYELHGAWGEAMRQLGNAVPVHLAEKIAAHIYMHLAAAPRSQ